jgi:eukaryotic-like serine/threonine-protein kinase
LSRPDVLVADRYRLVDRIADGGMSTVWEAWDERLQRKVAVKKLRLQPGLSQADARLAADRAMREARITARLHHPHAVPVYDVVYDDGAPCLVMQYLPSHSLQALIADRGALPADEVARMGREVASALGAAHSAGIVHRDVKPGNVLIDEHGSAKLTDFGISHALGDVTLTSTGMVTGTPAFLAPEVARGDASGYPSDVFSLGATLYAALEGRPPVGDGDNPMALLHRVASGNVIPPSRSGPLTPLLDRMLALDPAARPPIGEVEAELAAIENGVAQHTTAVNTRQLAGPLPAGPPPSTTVMLPPARPGPPPSMPRPLAGPLPPPPPPVRRSRRGAWIAGAAVVLALLLAGGGILLASQLGGGSDNAGGGQTTARTSSSHAAPRTSARNSSSHSSSPAAPPQPTGGSAANGGGGGGAGGGEDNGKTKSGSDDGSSTTPVQAVQNYYSLLPDDTDAAWKLLTPSFQQGRAGGRQSYDDYWSQMRTVTAGNATASGPSTVEATITYTYKSGKVVSEQTSFGLVQQGHTWKINSQS